MSRVLHAALPDDWVLARAAGHYAVSTRGHTLEAVGFIHASTERQLPGVLAIAYADLAELVLLVLDIEALAAAGSPVQWDEVPGQPAPYPHVYGPVPTTVVGQGNAVVDTLPLRRGADQDWLLPDLSPYALATGPAR